MILEKAIEIQQAKRRRAKLLSEFKRLGWTQRKFAAKHNMSASRMGQLLKKAAQDV